MLNTWQQTLQDKKEKQKNFSEDFESVTTPQAFKLKDDFVKKEESNKEQGKLDRLVHSSTTVLLTVKTVFPFTFFPNEIIITLGDVSVVYTEFFSSKQIRSVAISKIAEVIVETGFFFAELKIIDKEYSQMTMQIDYLSLKDAMKAKRLIQGLLFASKEGVDLNQIEDENLPEKIEELGRVQGEELDKD